MWTAPTRDRFKAHPAMRRLLENRRCDFRLIADATGIVIVRLAGATGTSACICGLMANGTIASTANMWDTATRTACGSNRKWNSGSEVLLAYREFPPSPEAGHLAQFQEPTPALLDCHVGTGQTPLPKPAWECRSNKSGAARPATQCACAKQTGLCSDGRVARRWICLRYWHDVAISACYLR